AVHAFTSTISLHVALPIHSGDAGPAPPVRRADVGDAFPRTPGRGRPFLRGPRSQDPLGGGAEGDSPRVPGGQTSAAPPRLRRNPRAVLPGPRCRFPGGTRR